MQKKIILIASAAIILVCASFFIFSSFDEEEIPVVPETPAPKKIAVYVSGQVKTPAVVTLEDTGSLRAVDAVNAVGGLTELADAEFINLAEPISDGQHIHIPTKEIFLQEIAAAAPNKSGNFAQTAQAGDLININTADETELQKLKGVGPVIAGRIVEYRQSNGAFQTIDEIKKVRGIGNKTFEKMRDSITVN